MSTPYALSDKEMITAIVYGDTFALYDRLAFEEFLSPLRQRLKKNGISKDVFSGKRCLDAGCGGGRGSIFMAECGAGEVVGVDLSPKNIESCQLRAKQYGFPRLSFQQCSLAQLPFENESFDVVWCNGVLHHATEPDKGLKEITRVLKKGGHLWLYLYGSGGIYWYVMDWIRNLLKGVDVQSCICQLRLMGAPVGRIAEWVDDWFTPYLRRYTRNDVMDRLRELGYEDTPLLDQGVTYDTSQRRIDAPPSEVALMGEGDIRYFGQKLTVAQGTHAVLPEAPDGKGSIYVENPLVTQYASTLDRIEKSIGRLGHGASAAAYRVIAAVSIHSRVRSLLETSEKFDQKSFSEHLSIVNSLLDQLRADL